ncbi:hypothetical protein FHS85_003020 [Rhodoligotrophos appendicifer]|uniref:SspB family protein n=1 Tax=Rhodoligotrophos appendicifer TaxID=987056 RepID=UPI001186FA10|nr:ClpXP protease specificity-enhancing factor SspB [Rhodoligotrophos appendicifer]
MAEDLMRYDLMAQDALRGVVKTALKRAARVGLPGEHHFYIAFDTNHPGVRISERLRKKYPDEMTIVLQHQFWSLEVYEDRFEVDLSFDNIPERLSIPLIAVKGFFDPSVQFGLQFEVAQANENSGLAEENAASTPEPIVPAGLAAPKAESAQDKKGPAKKTAKSAANEQDESQEGAEAKVVKLDTFRKK